MLPNVSILQKCTVYKKNARKLIKTEKKISKTKKANTWFKNKIEKKNLKEKLT